MKKLIEKYNLKDLKLDINKYGFKYSTKDYLIENLVAIVTVILLAYFSKLELKFILALVLVVILLMPIMIRAYFNEACNLKKFAMLTDYLGNIIPIFTQKTKVRFTLNELVDLTNGQMQLAIKRAVSYLDNTTNDKDMNKNALMIIEREFPNSRIRAVHNLLLSIELANSLAYKEVCQNMHDDIEGWIKRVYTFEKDLKNRRNKLIILCLATLVMNCLFVSLYISNDYFSGFTSSTIYQCSSFAFMVAILVVLTLIISKLHGEWLINDLDDKNDEQLKKDYDLYKAGIPKLKKAEIIFLIICLLASALLIYLKKYSALLVILMVIVFMLSYPSSRYKKAYKHINKALTIEFPVWLREISLTLNSLTVLNAIDLSTKQVSYPMRKELKIFLEEAKNNPISIKPYSNFLIDFDLEDARSSMKVLYAIKNVGQADIKDRVSNLIYRNQEMLAKAENLRNNDALIGIEALGYIPTIVFSLQMMISMFAMFTYLISNIAGAINL